MQPGDASTNLNTRRDGTISKIRADLYVRWIQEGVHCLKSVVSHYISHLGYA